MAGCCGDDDRPTSLTEAVLYATGSSGSLLKRMHARELWRQHVDFGERIVLLEVDWDKHARWSHHSKLPKVPGSALIPRDEHSYTTCTISLRQVFGVV